jgi:hypothetical protein
MSSYIALIQVLLIDSTFIIILAHISSSTSYRHMNDYEVSYRTPVVKLSSQVADVCEFVADIGHGSPAAAALVVTAAQQLPLDMGWQCWALPLAAGLLVSSYPPTPAEVSVSVSQVAIILPRIMSPSPGP